MPGLRLHWPERGGVAARKSMVPFSLVGGVVIGTVARAAGAPTWGLLVVPLLIAVSGGSVYFLEELRRPYLFTVPGAAWKRILAAGGVGWADGAVSGSLLYGVSAAAARIPLMTAVVACAYLVSAMAAGQLAAMLSFTLTPGWIGGTTRSSLRFYLALLAVLPGLVPWVVTATGVASFAPAPWAWPGAGGGGCPQSGGGRRRVGPNGASVPLHRDVLTMVRVSPERNCHFPESIRPRWQAP